VNSIQLSTGCWDVMALMADEPERLPDTYCPSGPNSWYLNPCLDSEHLGSGDRPLEKRYLEPRGLYTDGEIGEGPDSWGI